MKYCLNFLPLQYCVTFFNSASLPYPFCFQSYFDFSSITSRADLGVGRRGRSHPFFSEILYYFYRILRKKKSIYIAGKWASIPVTPF